MDGFIKWKGRQCTHSAHSHRTGNLALDDFGLAAATSRCPISRHRLASHELSRALHKWLKHCNTVHRVRVQRQEEQTVFGR